MACFSCAFAFGSYFRVWSSYKKTLNLNLKNLGFSSPAVNLFVSNECADCQSTRVQSRRTTCGC